MERSGCELEHSSVGEAVFRTSRRPVLEDQELVIESQVDSVSVSSPGAEDSESQELLLEVRERKLLEKSSSQSGGERSTSIAVLTDSAVKLSVSASSRIATSSKAVELGGVRGP